MKEISKRLIVFLLVLGTLLSVPSGMAQTMQADAVASGNLSESIDELTKRILLKGIELERFNLHYTLEVAKQGRWKGLRYATLQEANAGMNLAGGIVSTHNRGKFIQRASGVRRHTQEVANYVPMIGNIIGAGAAMGELGINGYHDFVARARGYSPSESIRRVKALSDQTRHLMAQREALIKQEEQDPARTDLVRLHRIEGRLLGHTFDQSLQEFVRYHVGARSLLGFQQSQYAFDCAKYTTNAIGFYFAYLSLDRGRRLWNGKAGVLYGVAGGLTMIAPITSRLIGKGVGLLTARRARKALGDTSDAKIASLREDIAELDKIVKAAQFADSSTANVLERQAAFETHEKHFSREILAQEKKSAAAKLTATQNIASGVYVGASKVASALLFMICGFDQNYNNKSSRASKVTNELLFASAVVGLPSSSYSILDTLRIQVKGEINRHKSEKAGTLPKQIAAARLKELDEIERRLTTK